MPKQKIKNEGAFVDLGGSSVVNFPMSAASSLVAPTFVALASGTLANATQHTVNKPAGVIAGDLIVIVANLRGESNGIYASTVTPPPGFTAISPLGITTPDFVTMYKYVGSSEPASYTFTLSASAYCIPHALAWRGADIPVYVDKSSINSYSAPTYTASKAGVVVVGVFAAMAGGWGDTVASTGWDTRVQNSDSTSATLVITKSTTGVGSYTPNTSGTTILSFPQTFVIPGGGSSYTLLASDAGKVVEIGTPTGASVTIPPNLFSVGDVIRIRQGNVGVLSLIAGSGVSVSGFVETLASGDELWLYMRAVNVWSSLLIPNNPATQAELDAVVASLSVIGTNNQVDSYGLVLADAGKVIELNKATALNLTVPLNATQAFPIGTVIELWQQGAGQVTVVATGGVTIRSTEGKLKLYGQYSGASLRKRGTDEWVLIGDLVA